MEKSILNSVKKVVGVGNDDTSFDVDIILHINSVFATLHELGIGPDLGFRIEDAETTWDEFLLGDLRFNQIQSYIGARVRLLFDPPTTSYAVDALKEQIKEFEWRINTQREALRYVPTLP